MVICTMQRIPTIPRKQGYNNRINLCNFSTVACIKRGRKGCTLIQKQYFYSRKSITRLYSLGQESLFLHKEVIENIALNCRFFLLFPDNFIWRQKVLFKWLTRNNKLLLSFSFSADCQISTVCIHLGIKSHSH